MHTLSLIFALVIIFLVVPGLALYVLWPVLPEDIKNCMKGKS